MSVKKLHHKSLKYLYFNSNEIGHDTRDIVEKLILTVLDQNIIMPLKMPESLVIN